MKRVGGWLGTSAGYTSSRSMTALDEQNALQEAMTSATLIINDEIERAETELSKGTSPFHKLGRATALFLRASLGFEKDVMEEAAARLAEAEAAAAEHQRRAIRDPSRAHRSKIYPVGAEYALCQAEAQLMSAVVAVLNESLTESLRGFYKLRRASAALQEIHDAEQKYLRSRGKGGGSLKSPNAASAAPVQHIKDPKSPDSSTNGSGILKPETAEADDDLDFVAVEDETSETPTVTNHQGHMDDPVINNLGLQETNTNKLNGSLPSTTQPSGVAEDSNVAVKDGDEDLDFRNITSDPIDLFIHSGTGLCLGLLQLMVSMVPPAFKRLLSLFSFQGTREAGLNMLWRSTTFKHNINGALAGLITLGFHNGAIASCDILSHDSLPELKLRTLLREMRQTYPDSKMWLLEESRVLSRDHKLEEAVEIIVNGPKSSLKQVEALGQFEMAMTLMYLSRFEECAEAFIICSTLNSWSPALYYYIAGACYIELYRAVKDLDPEKAKGYAAKARKYLREVPAHAAKKRFMSRQLPLDAFVMRKVTKWDARAKARGCKFIDAVGVSPVAEMTYFWNGFKRMRVEDINRYLESLARAEDATSCLRLNAEDTDERAVLNLIRGVCRRCMDQVSEAKEILTDQVISQDMRQIKACEHAENWAQPVGHYEMAVCLWIEAGGEDGDKALLNKCSEELSKAERWESFEMEARIGLKITTARKTLQRAGIGPS